MCAALDRVTLQNWDALPHVPHQQVLSNIKWDGSVIKHKDFNACIVAADLRAASEKYRLLKLYPVVEVAFGISKQLSEQEKWKFGARVSVPGAQKCPVCSKLTTV